MSNSGILNDTRLPFYTDVTKYSNLYRLQNSIGTEYGHHIAEATMPEYVRFDGCVAREGLRGRQGALFRAWDQKKLLTMIKLLQIL